MPMAYVLINAEIGSEEALGKELLKVEGVIEASIVYGVYDIVAKVEADTMEELKQTRETQERIKNSIIIIHALFDKNDSPDEFTSRGINATELTKEDMEICHAQLRKELLIQ